jgi:hypothetical protein
MDLAQDHTIVVQQAVDYVLSGHPLFDIFLEEADANLKMPNRNELFLSTFEKK